jgi:hypothetical protein
MEGIHSKGVSVDKVKSGNEQFDISSMAENVVIVSEKLNFIVEKKIVTASRNVGIILKLFAALQNEQHRKRASIFRTKTGEKLFTLYSFGTKA